MKYDFHDVSFIVLTSIAGLDLLAAVVTDVPNAVIGSFLAACVALLMINERLRPAD